MEAAVHRLHCCFIVSEKGHYDRLESLPADLEDRLRQLTADLTHREATGRDLVRFACDLLVVGVSPESAVNLAGLPFEVAMREAAPLFRRLVTDLGRPKIPTDETGWMLARRTAEQLVANGIPAAIGASRLWDLWSECGNPPQLAAFRDLLDAWERRSQADRTPIEEAIRALAPAVIAAADRAFRGQVTKQP